LGLKCPPTDATLQLSAAAKLLLIGFVCTWYSFAFALSPYRSTRTVVLLLKLGCENRIVPVTPFIAKTAIALTSLAPARTRARRYADHLDAAPHTNSHGGHEPENEAPHSTECYRGRRTRVGHGVLMLVPQRRVALVYARAAGTASCAQRHTRWHHMAQHGDTCVWGCERITQRPHYRDK
jgi:hypothetical protein